MIRLIDANKLFEEVGHIKPENLKHYDYLGDFMKMITNSPTIKPPVGYQPMEGGWMYFGLPDSIERVIYCQDCVYYNGHECYCDNDHYARDWGYCYMAARSYETDESNTD